MSAGLLNILVITVRADYGGGPEHLFRLMNQLKERANFFAACPKDYPYFDRYIDLIGSENIINIPHRKFRLAALFRLSRFAREKNISIIHSHGKGAGVYSRLLSFLTGKKCIHTFHGIHIKNYNYVKKMLYLQIEKLLAHLTERFISVSQSEAAMVSRLNFAPSDKITLIWNGTVIPEKPASFDFDGDKIFNIVSITRFDAAKNSMLLIPVCKELQKIWKNSGFQFLIIGDGEEAAELRKRIDVDNLQDFFHLTGNIPTPGEHLIRSFCYISTSRWEGLPLGVLEAMSYGLPVIATNVTGNKDLVEHGINGFLYGLNNPAEAAEFIVRLSEDREMYKTFANSCRAAVKQKYGLAEMAEKTYNLYMDCVKQ